MPTLFPSYASLYLRTHIASPVPYASFLTPFIPLRLPLFTFPTSPGRLFPLPPGTGTVVVDVDDVNDVPPRFSRPEWTLDVSESLEPDHVLATLTVVDQGLPCFVSASTHLSWEVASCSRPRYGHIKWQTQKIGV